MDILQISTADVIGGAARAAFRLHRGLIGLGHNSSMFVARRHSNDSSVKIFQPPRDLLSRLRRRLRRRRITRSFSAYQNHRQPDDEVFSDDRSEYGATMMQQLPYCDVINLHWTAGFVDYMHFFQMLPSHVPIVWTLHDMNAFTGGCHYDQGCGKYKSTCGSCPQLGSFSSSDLSHQIWNRKSSIYRKIEPGKLHFVALNKWMAEEAKNSSLLHDFPVKMIPNGLDTEVFSPRDCKLARDALEIPRDARAILFVADSIKDRRKGFDFLANALQYLNDVSNLFLISLGKGKPTLDVAIPHLHLGHVENDRLLSLVYSATDVFVIPSLQDNLPNTVLESLACGTPVVGFDVGGIPEMIHSGVTGLLAAPEDVNSLRKAIAALLNGTTNLKAMAVNCRNTALEEYSLQVQARRYSELYTKIIRTFKRDLK